MGDSMMEPTASPTQPGAADALPGHLSQEFARQETLLSAQPRAVQIFLEAQGRQLAQAIVDHLPNLRFTLPDQVAVESTLEAPGELRRVPTDTREQMAVGLMDRLTRVESRVAVRQRLRELEQSSDPAVSTGARLMLHATVTAMIHTMLPAGRSVTYATAEGENIPAVPVGDSMAPESALTAATDAIAEEGAPEAGRGDLLVPYVPAARRFFLPQWVAFDDSDRLLVGSVSEAEAHVASMQRYLGVLHAAVSLAPYVVADPEYQRRRHGILGQLVNQGRALCRYTTREIIATIRARAASGELNRGLSLSLPYFDDQDLEIRTLNFVVIPAGRILFVSAFVVRAAQEESVKVAQDTRLDPATRKHLLAELQMLEEAFDASRQGSASAGR
jgi:hypothetical protein